MENKNQTYSGKSIAEQLLQNTWVGKLLYGKPKTYTDGYGVKRKDATFKESANGQEIQRMKKTVKDAGNLVATGLAFGNPLTASKALAPLITAAQAYWIGHGIKDGSQRIENIGKEAQNFVENPSWQNAGTIVKEVPMLALDVAGALPVAKTVIETGKNAVPAAQQAAQRIAGSVDDAITNATKQAVESGVVGVNELPTQLATRVTSTPKVQEPILNVGWAPSQTMSVRRAGELTEMYYPNRWDVVEEGANPFGVWLQGKFGTPRTDITNPGKGERAVKARELFANRPQYNGKVTFKKPIQTIGEVPNRSTLSYEAERMGADGIIYNGVYDNGYNNNQVIFSFNKPELGKGYSLFERPSKLTEAERLGIPKGQRSNPKALEDPQYWGYQQWNDRYNSAVESGNWSEAQKLRDLHFKIKAPDTKVVDENGMPLHTYHGTMKHFTVFNNVNPKDIKLKTGGYHTVNYDLANSTYGKGGYYDTTNGKFFRKYGIVYDDYLNITNPFIDTPSHNISDIVGKITRGNEYPNWGSLRDSGRVFIKNGGFDGVFVPRYHNTYLPTNSASQIKSAEPITWNGKGEIIPIVKRDNFRNLDRRYKKGGKL